MKGGIGLEIISGSDRLRVRFWIYTSWWIHSRALSYYLTSSVRPSKKEMASGSSLGLTITQVQVIILYYIIVSLLNLPNTTKQWRTKFWSSHSSLPRSSIHPLLGRAYIILSWCRNCWGPGPIKKSYFQTSRFKASSIWLGCSLSSVFTNFVETRQWMMVMMAMTTYRQCLSK
jgi:hypothetical protein